MTLSNPLIREEISEVQPWLQNMGLANVDFESVAKAMMGEYADDNPFYSRAKAGTYAFHQGLYSIRQEVVGQDDWVVFRSSKNLEGVRSDSRKVVILISGVTIACSSRDPVKRTKCGSATEEVSGQQGMLFEDLPISVSMLEGGDTHYWFMADEAGNAEISRPIIKKGVYVGFIERNKVVFADGDDFDETAFGADDAVNDFDIDVVRKAS